MIPKPHLPEEILKNFPPITAEDKNSFAFFTLTQRLPYFIDQIIKENTYSPQIVEKLYDLKNEVLTGVIKEIPQGPDEQLWHDKLGPHAGKSWFEAPFFCMEVYFFRRIMDITGYFNTGIDPFKKTKVRDASSNLLFFTETLEFVNQECSVKPDIHFLSGIIKINLWANKADLSQLEQNNQDDGHYLIDQSEQMAEILSGKNLYVADIILDNAGVELFSDLLMAVVLLRWSLVKKIRLHAKAHPIFISDTIRDDITSLLDTFRASGMDILQRFAEEVIGFIGSGALEICDHPFWTLPLPFYHMPDDLRSDIRSSDLLIIKGDANYRRLFDDRMLPVDFPVLDFCTYLEVPAFALRTLKSEILAGYDRQKAAILNETDSDWMINGNNGLIQCINL